MTKTQRMCRITQAGRPEEDGEDGGSSGEHHGNGGEGRHREKLDKALQEEAPFTAS